MLRRKEILASLALLAPVLDAQQAVATRTLQPFLPPTLQAISQRASAIPSGSYNGTRSGQLAERDTELTWLSELLQVRHKQAIRASALQILLDDRRRCTLLGTAEAVEACAADLDALASAFSRTIQLAAYQLPLGDGALPEPFLNAVELREMLDGTTPIWTSHARIRSGASVELQRAQWQAYLRDLDAEVAEKTQILDPRFDKLFVGTSCRVTVHSLPGERLLLHGSWLSSRLVEMREQAIRDGGASIDLPHVQTLSASFSGQIANGHALLVAARGEQPNGVGMLLVVTARYVSPAPSLPEGLGVLPISAWQSTQTCRGTPGPARFPGEELVAPEAETGLLSPSNVASLLGAFGKSTVANGYLVGQADGEAMQTAQATLAQLCSANDRSLAMRVTRDGTAGRSGIDFVQPTLAGLPSHAFFGNERSVLADFAVEVALQSSCANPIVHTARGGLWSWCTVTADGRGGHYIDGVWRSAQQDAARLRSIATEPPMLAECTSYTTSIWPWSGSVPADREHALSAGVRIRVSERTKR